MALKICRHCKDRVVSRPRGLCHRCYYTPEIRAQYPAALSDSAIADFTGPAKIPEPTTAPPMTAAKLEVLAHRALHGQNLFDRRDATLCER
jgi:hypothetical protein